MSRVEVRFYKRKSNGGSVWSLWILFPDSDWILLGFGAKTTVEHAEADAHKRAASIASAMIKFLKEGAK